MKNLFTGRLGFTLIELLVVVLIIGILAAIALPQYQKAVGRARMVEFMTQARAIHHAQKFYRLATGSYPQKMSDLNIWNVDSSNTSHEKAVWGKQTYSQASSYTMTYVNIPGIEKFYCRIWLSQYHATCYAYTEKGQKFLESYNWPLMKDYGDYKRYHIMYVWNEQGN